MGAFPAEKSELSDRGTSDVVRVRSVAPILNNGRFYTRGPSEYLEPGLFILDHWGFIVYNFPLEIMGSGEYLKI
jgi:hypothetical protein